MLTTKALIEAALARGLELPGEWFEKYRPPHAENHTFVYIGPDLTAPVNLYELMRFADAVGDEPINKFPVSIEWDVDASAYKTHVGGRIGTGPDRTTAVIAACAKALGLEGHNQ